MQSAAQVSGASTPSASHTLSSLSRESFPSLAALYARAASPTSLSDLSGTPKGRMLAVRGVSPGEFFGARLRTFAGSQAFVWDGKSFSAHSPRAGQGINRVRVPGVLGSQQLFPFHTSIGPSRVDGRPAILLDYDLKENPGYIRRIHDEVRPLGHGLYLGPAMWKHRERVTTVLFFALLCDRVS
jgi:hypothetical protein